MKLNLFFRLAASFMGGVLGSSIMFIIHFLNTSLFSNTAPIIKFFLIFMVFLGSLVANLSCGIFFNLSYPEKYNQKIKMLWQSFLINIFLFFIVFPFYTIFSEIQYIALFHVLFTVFASNIIYEMFTLKNAYLLTGIYGSLFALLLESISIFYLQNTNFSEIIIFIILPLIWLTTTFCTIIIEYLYALLYKISGISFLNPNTKFN